MDELKEFYKNLKWMIKNNYPIPDSWMIFIKCMNEEVEMCKKENKK